eukprot:TRINITY_DN5837_c0_g1_i1.p1 TRINITY_DN5837_c0_g1~~TRINITY_DN5837_c0_g1_i1.p1  ORF type:complete len:174 (+),score=50.90 TRINITY_DN5837_c0_g1_i1:110-631(+)
MANQGAKRRKEENQRHLLLLQYIIVGVNVFYIVVRLSFMYSSFSWRHWLGLILTTSAYKLCYDQIANMAKPTVDERGELLDGGFDLNLGGLCAYLHDIIYITAFVQITSILSDWFWLVYLVIPGFALWKLWELVLQPYFFQHSQEEVEDEKSRKKREKAERKAARPKYSKVRF